MTILEIDEIRKYFLENFSEFHQRRLTALQKVNLSDLLHLNAYLLYRKLTTMPAGKLIEQCLDSFLISTEEKLFNRFMNDLAEFIAHKTGREYKQSSKTIHYEYFSQSFWYQVSGIKTLYSDVIEPLCCFTGDQDEDFEIIKAGKANFLTKEFLDAFCNPASGEISWEKVVEANSGNFDLDQFIA